MILKQYQRLLLLFLTVFKSATRLNTLFYMNCGGILNQNLYFEIGSKNNSLRTIYRPALLRD